MRRLRITFCVTVAAVATSPGGATAAQQSLARHSDAAEVSGLAQLNARADARAEAQKSLVARLEQARQDYQRKLAEVRAAEERFARDSAAHQAEVERVRAAELKYRRQLQEHEQLLAKGKFDTRALRTMAEQRQAVPLSSAGRPPEHKAAQDGDARKLRRGAVAQLAKAGTFPHVILSYPAIVTPKASEILREKYLSNPVPKKQRGVDSYGEAFEDSLSKTAFYVLDFYRALKASSPGISLVLQPATVDLDDSGRLTYSVPAQGLPAAVRADFLAYAYPGQQSSGYPAGLHSMGGNVTPLISVASEGTEFAGSAGTAIYMEPFKGVRAHSEQPSVLLQIASLTQGRGKLAVPKNVSVLEPKRLKIPGAAWSRHLTAWGKGQTALGALFAPYTKAITGTLGSINQSQWQELALDRYLKALAVPGISRSEGVDRLLQKFAKAEAEWASRQSEQQLETLLRGAFGQSMRTRIEKEREYIAAANAASFAQGLMALSGAMSSMAAGTPIGLNQQVMSLLTDTSIDRMGDAHRQAFEGIAAEQQSVAIETAEGAQVVQAATLRELRDGFRQILAKHADSK